MSGSMYKQIEVLYLRRRICNKILNRCACHHWILQTRLLGFGWVYETTYANGCAMERSIWFNGKWKKVEGDWVEVNYGIIRKQKNNDGVDVVTEGRAQEDKRGG